ncbi:MAG: T9SS type A sorting domain-containing protein [Chitinophagales bacterium]
MKTLVHILPINFFVFCLFNVVFAQINPATNSLLLQDPLIIPSANNSAEKTEQVDTATAACTVANTFWGEDGATVKEYSIDGNTISATGDTIPGYGFFALAICNNLNGGNISPTFYATSFGSYSGIYAWNGGGSWIQVDTSNNPILNGGGNGNYLYWLDNLYVPDKIIRYDGTNCTTIFTTNKSAAVADVASDDEGNVYFVTNFSFPNSDSLYVISPSGQILKQYPFVLDCNNAYGMFLLNSLLYIGLGSINTTYPNTLIPVTFTPDSVSIGTPISVPLNIALGNDLASCTPGSPLGIASIETGEDLSLYPNPVHESLIVKTNQFQNEKFSIVDVTGKIVLASTLKGNATTIDMSNLRNGIYFFEIQTAKETMQKKFCKM